MLTRAWGFLFCPGSVLAHAFRKLRQIRLKAPGAVSYGKTTSAYIFSTSHQKPPCIPHTPALQQALQQVRNMKRQGGGEMEKECSFCGGVRNIRRFKSGYVCEECLDYIKKAGPVSLRERPVSSNESVCGSEKPLFHRTGIRHVISNSSRFC